jgi:choline dehydrogenase-like flavoprotein
MSSVNKSTLIRKATSVIIGSGAGGAVAFYELAKRESVLLLEEGSISLEDVRNNSVAEINRSLYRNAGLRLALGFPIVTIGEGKCIGGSTEINGGLFWRLPEHVKAEWRLLGFDEISQGALNKHFLFFEKLLGVRPELLNKETDVDSFLMHQAAKRLNWKSVPAPRLVPNCVRSNMCASGCPSLAKNSMSRTLIPTAQKNGGQLISQYAVKKLIPTDDGILIVPSDRKNQLILAQECIVSCGAIESPRLLARSGILSKKMVRIGFHANFKLIARFNESVQARKGTIFTHQIQEFESRGFLIMPANLSKEYLATSSSHLDSSTFGLLQEQLDSLGLYTIQVRVKGSLLDFFPGSPKFNL